MRRPEHRRIFRWSTLSQLGNTEVEDFHETVFPDDDVLGFDVTVNNTTRMRSIESCGHLPSDCESRRHIESSSLQLTAESLAFNILGDDKARFFIEVVNSENILMIDLRKGLRLVSEVLHPRFIVTETFR